MNENIFREYDIRGIVEDDFTESTVKGIASAFATNLINNYKKNCVIGYDARLSADYLYKIFSSVLLNYGIDIVCIEMTTSPMLYFAQKELNIDSAVMITGSHNPSNMNGFKMIIGENSVYGKEIQKLKNMILNNNLIDFSLITKKGKESKISIEETYLDFLKNNIHPGNKKQLKIVVDGGNGTGGEIAVKIFKHFGYSVTGLYTKPDGTFPNHHPDPTVPANMVDLISKVKDENADLGIGYDGDADRIGVVDNEGNLLFGDQLMLLFAREILERKPGAVIVGEVKCSKNLYDDIAKHGGNGIMWKAGHSLIKAKMKETNAELGGEVSGHIFFKDRFFGHDDALYASLRLVEILTTTGKSLTELLSDVPKTYMTPEIRLESNDNTKFEIVKQVVAFFKNAGYNVCDVDGVRVIFDDGFGLVRASNTQPALVQRYEGITEKRANEIRSLVEGKLNEIEKSVGGL